MKSDADSQRPTSPLRLDRGGDLTRLRRAMEGHGYTAEALAQIAATGSPGDPLQSPWDIAAMLRRTGQETPLHTLVRLFVLARPVPAESARAALAPVDPEDLVDLGLLARDAAGLRSTLAVVPCEGIYLAHDFWAQVTGGPSGTDCVPGVGPATRALAAMTVRRPAGLALDLGTGSGFHALVAAGHAQRVIGTDINARALAIAAFNARLNGLANVEWREGSFFEPVRGERFDLIVANPPFVISPQTDFQYRDSGLPGDAISEQVVRGAGGQLSEGGFCTVLFNWHHQSGDDWADRPRSWLEGSGCDAWLVCAGTDDPVRYSLSWLRTGAQGEVESCGRLLDQWLAYYERLGIGAISEGAVVLRRRAGGANWRRTERVPPGRPQGSASDQIERVFAAEDLLDRVERAGGERELLECRFGLTPDHEVEQTLRAADGRWQPGRSLLKQTEGFAFRGELAESLQALLAALDGRRTLAEAADELAARHHIDPGQVRTAAVEAARGLLRSGFLTVASPP